MLPTQESWDLDEQYPLLAVNLMYLKSQLTSLLPWRQSAHGETSYFVKSELIVCYYQVGASAGAVPKGGPRKHIISVSTYQMVILMLFNTRERLTYEVSLTFNLMCVLYGF